MNKLKSFVKLALILALVVGVQGTCLAGAYKNFGKIWEKSGGLAATTSMKYYKGQSGGHYTLGSMYFAREKKNRPLVSVRFPEINVNNPCLQDAVLSLGGLSHISGTDLVKKLKTVVIGTGMMYAYQGFNSISPVLGSTLQEVFSKIQELSGFAADECRMSQMLKAAADDIMTQHSSIAQSIATRFGSGGGENEDITKAYNDYPKNKSKALATAASKDESLLLEDVNLAWKALEKLNLKDIEVKKFMMSISGTVIIHAAKKDTQEPEFQYISSNITSPQLLRALLKGGSEAPILECSEIKKCLSVTTGTKTITKEEGFEHRVAQYFEKFKSALESDTDIAQGNSDVHSFLSSSGLPVYKIYDVLFQYTNANPEYEQGIFVEIVAWNILYNYLSDTLKQVSEAANNLKIAAAPQLKDFRTSLVHTQKMLADLEMKDLNRTKTQLFLVNRAEGFEKTMADEVSKAYSMERG